MSEANPEGHVHEFRLAGETLFACGCNNSHSGNLSIRDGGAVIITRTGAMLHALAPGDLVRTSLSPTDAERQAASTELSVHLAIYRATPSTAIAHGHAPWAVLAGWMTDELRPIDVEGAYYFGSIPVIECVPATASPVLGETLVGALARAPVAIVRGHGVFAVGDTLERAMQRITSVNDSARYYVEAERLGLDLNELAAKRYLRFPDRQPLPPQGTSPPHARS
jgi:L-fuculose-phosphate aldolase